MDKEWMSLFKELANMGDKEAMLAFASEHVNSNSEYALEEERHLTISYLTSLATEDNATNINYNAMLQLGALYYTGWFEIEQSYTNAREWYEKAAVQKTKSEIPAYQATDTTHWALNNLGYCYYYGRETEIDYKKAYYYFAKSAFYKNFNAMYKIGDMYYYGYYVKNDYKTAYFWYKEAERHSDGRPYGYANIAYRLGLCNLYGNGTEKDLFAALRHLQKAEMSFYRLLENNDSFAHLTLPKVQKELGVVRRKLNKIYIPNSKLNKTGVVHGI